MAPRFPSPLLLAALLPAALVAAQDSKSGSGPGYQYYCVGIDCSNTAVDPETSPGAVFMGGSTDVDDAFLWQIGKAGNGDFVVLRATGSDAYNSYIEELGGGYLNSVTTIILSSAVGSSQPFVLNAVNTAAAIFFAGGDQTLYVERISGTPLALALQNRSKYITVGGTSAGADYLSQFIFSPPTDAASIESADALYDPYMYGIDFVNGTFPFAGFATGGARRTLADTHYEQRDRAGRNLVFAARLFADGAVEDGCVNLISVNERSALLVGPDGSAVVAGGSSASAAFVCRLCTPPTVCSKGTPLTAGPFDCMRLARNADSYDFESWSGTGEQFTLSVNKGVISGTPYGA